MQYTIDPIRLSNPFFISMSIKRETLERGLLLLSVRSERFPFGPGRCAYSCLSNPASIPKKNKHPTP